MRKTIVLLAVAVGLIVIGTSSSWALYPLCGGRVYNSIGEPQANAYVQGCGQNLLLTDYSNTEGYYGLNDNEPPPTGYYDLCARKNDVGKATTTIYHEWGHSNEWNPYLSGAAGQCPACEFNK